LPSQNGNPPPSPLSPRTIPCRSTPFLPKAELWSPKATKPAEPALSSQAGASALAISTISAIAGALRDPILYRD
jgi:hypothetical protein